MQPLVALVLLAQLFSCKATSPAVLPFPPLVHRLIDCDAPEAEEAANVALNYINRHNSHGYKQAINVIEKIIVHPRRPTGEIFFLELDLLETNCHVLDPVPVANCTVRPRIDHAVEGDCDVKMLKQDGQFTVLAAKCHSTPDSAEDVVKLCPDCSVLALLDDPGVVSAVQSALHAFNALNTTLGHYHLLEISRGKYSHMPKAVHVEFAIGSTNCTHADIDHAEGHCHVETGAQSHAGFCKASVFQTVPEKVDVHCDIFEQAGHSHSHKHLAVHHVGGNHPSPGHGRTVLDLIHSHNNTQASHESSEHVVPAVPAAVVKRSAVEVANPAEAGPPPAAPAVPLGPLHLCPGRVRHFKL